MKVIFVLWFWTYHAAAMESFETMAQCEAVKTAIQEQYKDTWGKEHMINKDLKCLEVKVPQ